MSSASQKYFSRSSLDGKQKVAMIASIFHIALLVQKSIHVYHLGNAFWKKTEGLFIFNIGEKLKITIGFVQNLIERVINRVI